MDNYFKGFNALCDLAEYYSPDSVLSELARYMKDEQLFDFCQFFAKNHGISLDDILAE